MPSAPGPRSPAYAAFAHRPFRWFIASLLTMTMAAQVQAVVVGWMVYEITKDPFALGLIGLAEVVPYVSVALLAGYVVDRSDRRRVSVLALGTLVLASLALFAFATLAPGSTRVWPFYAVIAVCGLARAFLQVSRSALVSEIVPPTVYPNAATWRSSVWQLGSVVGPALGGLLFAAFGARTAFGINVLLASCSLVAMLVVRHSPTPLAPTTESMRQSLVAALALDMMAVLFGGAVALLPVFAADILRVGPQGLGILQAAPGAGAVLMAFVIAHRPPFQRAGRSLLLAVVVFGLCIIGFAFSRHLALSVAFLFASGAADNVSAVIRSTMIQVMVPPEMLGRVSAVNAVFIGSSNELGAFESGTVAKLIGTVPAVVFGGSAAVLIALGMAWRVPVLRQLGAIRRE
jgi:predicted MFS family arabinose efflux permease